MAGKRFTEAQRRELLRLFQARTGSVEAFTRRYSVSAASLYQWQQSVDSSSPGGFIELKPDPSPAEKSCKLILQAGSVVLHFQTLPDAVWLTELIENIQQ
jgi:hypothetical protein